LGVPTALISPLGIQLNGQWLLPRVISRPIWFGERVLHVAQVNLMLLQALGAKAPAPAIDMSAASKVALLAPLQRVGEYGVAVIKEFEFGEQGLLARIDSPDLMRWFMGPKMSRQRALYFLMTHSQDTCGQSVVYARMNGIAPPASRQLWQPRC
jgi:hypothetical protein